MKLLRYPEVRYGPLPKLQQAEKLLAPRPDLQESDGAMEYLELHLERVKESITRVQRQGWGMWAIHDRVKGKKEFTNTTRALRMIMVYHGESVYTLNKMALRIEEELEQGGMLEPHYTYLLRLLRELNSPEAERILEQTQ